MEHRIGERNKTALTVAVSQGARFLGWCTTRDVCPGGISICGEVADLANSSVVNVALGSAQADSRDTQNFKALVIHQDDGCLGLMWIENPVGLNFLHARHASVSRIQANPIY